MRSVHSVHSVPAAAPVGLPERRCSASSCASVARMPHPRTGPASAAPSGSGWLPLSSIQSRADCSSGADATHRTKESRRLCAAPAGGAPGCRGAGPCGSAAGGALPPGLASPVAAAPAAGDTQNACAGCAAASGVMGLHGLPPLAAPPLWLLPPCPRRTGSASGVSSRSWLRATSSASGEAAPKGPAAACCCSWACIGTTAGLPAGWRDGAGPGFAWRLHGAQKRRPVGA